MLVLDLAPYVLKDFSGEVLRDRREGLTVVAEANRRGPEKESTHWR